MPNVNRKLIWGTRLLVLGWLVAVANPIESLIRRNDATLHHRIEPGTALVSVALAVIGIMVVVWPLRRAEKWAIWGTLVPMAVVGIPRLITDPACQLTDLSHHGCHQFMIALAIGAAGLVLSCAGIFGQARTSGAAA